jgi:putative ABC transport system permease protein
MNYLRPWLARLAAVFHWQRLDREMAEEFEAHLERETEQNIRRGLSPEEERNAARRAFGGMDQLKEIARDQRGWTGLEMVLKEFRLAVRMLAKSPGFTLVSVLLLALGIGANAAFFSVFKAQVLAPFPYPDAGRVMQIWRTNGTRLETNPWSPADFLDVHETCTTLAECGAYRPVRFTLGGDQPTSLQGVASTSGVWRALGVQTALGRWFTAEDERPGSPPTVLLSHACWVQHLGADSTLVGRTIRLDGQNYTVLGVMPADFEFYCPWTQARAIDLWVPLPLDAQVQDRGNHNLLVVGRLKSGASLSQANAELRILAERLAAAHPETNYRKWFYARPLPAELAGKALLRYGFIEAAVALVLLVACGNLAIMFLARGAGRQTEFAVRLALGASHWNLIRLAMIESIALAVLGGCAGVLLDWSAIGLLPRLFPPLTTHAVAIRLDGAVLGWAAILVAGAALGASILPALAAAKTQVVETIKQGSFSVAGSRARYRFLRHLVGMQVSIALFLSNTALLLTASYRTALAVSNPLSSDRVLAAQVTVKGDRYVTGAARAGLWEQLVARTKTLPGVTAAAVTTKLPLRGGFNRSVLVDGEAYDVKIPRTDVEQSWVSPEYFEAMGVHRFQGRTLGSEDARSIPAGVVVNRTLAEHYWPGQDPLGRRILSYSPNPEPLGRVVGVVDDVRQWDIGMPAQPEVYYPYARDPRNEAYLIVRSAFDARRLLPTLRHELAALDPDLALAEPTTMAAIVSEEAQSRQTLLVLTDFFMAAALIMTAIGIYGTLTFQLRLRTRELGVRLALGAAVRDIVGLVLQQTLPWLVGGGAIGLGLSIVIALALQRFFADLHLLNPLYYLAGVGALAGVLLAACWLPTRRAARLDPVIALRSE